MDAEEDIYQFNPERTHQGLALVIANFTEGKDKREGAGCDLKYMKKTFKRLGFKVDCHENVTKSDLDSLLNGYSQQEELKSYDCFVFAISSHGVEFVQEDEIGNRVLQHAIEMTDGSHIKTNDILDHFNDSNCKALENKPKLSFIQACRIPVTKATDVHWEKGIGFDSGISLQSGTDGQEDKIIGDLTDFRGTSRQTNTDSDRESDVSDTDVEEDEISLSGHITKTTAKGQELTLRMLQNEEPSQKATANENELPRLQANRFEEPYAHCTTNENEETSPQNAAYGCRKLSPRNSTEMTTDHDDDIDPTRVHRLCSPDSRGSGDYMDPPTGRHPYPQVPVEITLVPCHNDMLIMFASPQGHYAFRSKLDGSYMLRMLYESVENYYKNGRLTGNQTNFLDVLRDVTTRMSKMKFIGSKEYTNVPCIVHKLKKDVIFSHGKNMASTKFLIELSSCDILLLEQLILSEPQDG